MQYSRNKKNYYQRALASIHPRIEMIHEMKYMTCRRWSLVACIAFTELV